MSQTTSKTPSRIPISSSTWFITGIGRGLGRNIAEEVMQRGGRVAGTVRNLAHVDELKKQFPDQLWIGELDLSDLANIGSTFRGAVQHFGRVHAVVSNAGYSLLGAAEELQLDAIRHIVDTNLIGSIELARATVAHMRPLGGGRLVQVSSGAGQAAFPGLSLYCATKWGIEGFFDSLAQEVADFGVQTTLVEPGTIRTDFGTQVFSVLNWTPIATARSACCARWQREATLRQEIRRRWRKQLWRHSKPKSRRHASLLAKMSTDI
jgi:NAD(P)-dependent dehydrogenase (short-subunit alcohol dehydrogenase family)